MGAVVTLAEARDTRSRVRPEPDGGATLLAARDWLETQARVVEYWRDLLVAAGDDDELVEALDEHAAFLNGVAARL
jgi:hypothetical protein